MYEISNDTFRVGINPIGAELEYIKINNIDILWERSELWNAQSPVLFPVIGCLKDGFYSYQGQRYELPVHGFVKNMNFEVAGLDKNKITLFTTSNEETLKTYPFKFKFLVTYEVNNNSLNMKFDVINLDDKDIAFSLGVHPGFVHDGLAKILDGNYKFNYQANDLKEVFFTPTFVKGIGENTVNYNTFEEMSDDLEIKRTICLKGINEFDIYSNKHKLKFINEMSFMAFWHKKQELDPKFICVEAWEGIPDEDSKTDFDIFKKLGNVILKEKESYTKNFKIIYE